MVRHWVASGFTTALADDVIMNRAAIAQRVRRSPMCTQWYNRVAQGSSGRTTTTQLGVPKHRDDAWQKPRAQFCVDLPSRRAQGREMCVLLACTDEAKDAQRFLGGSGEKVLLFGHVGRCCE